MSEYIQEDRYSQTECELNPMSSRLAHYFETEAYHTVPLFARELMKSSVQRLFATIPIPVRWVAIEPYHNCPEMQRRVRDEGELLVLHHRSGHVTGHLTQQWRAVHDWFGHVLQDAPFSLSGEIEACGRHFNQFPRVCHPFLRSTVVLENNFRLNRGHWLCWPPHLPACPAKVVFDANYFGPEALWYERL